MKEDESVEDVIPSLPEETEGLPAEETSSDSLSKSDKPAEGDARN